MVGIDSDDRLMNRDVALVMAATFCFMASNMLVSPLMAGFSESLGAGGALMGVVAAMMNVVSLFCRPIAGNLADRTSKRTLVGIGAALYLVSSVWYALAGSPASLIAARMVNGVGFACCSVCLATWMAMLLPIRHMGAGMGLYGTMNALAMAIGGSTSSLKRISHVATRRICLSTAGNLSISQFSERKRSIASSMSSSFSAVPEMISRVYAATGATAFCGSFDSSARSSTMATGSMSRVSASKRMSTARRRAR